MYIYVVRPRWPQRQGALNRFSSSVLLWVKGKEKQVPHKCIVCVHVHVCVRVSVCVWGNQSNWLIKHPHMTAQKTTAVWMTSCLHCTKTSCTGPVRYVRNEPNREWERLIKASWLCPYVLMILDSTAVLKKQCIFGAKKRKWIIKPNHQICRKTFLFILQDIFCPSK